ncbi:MAG: hypothetical protein HON47_04270 [Candidatus Diapherotrites archaeon]|jgi:hypothetical protein|uniref:Uncharacterized protein n=1 Tax=Candidatus Iainarchaeum sp. TaxID=3101447 RepID=A0A8T5GF62_9ARCH|nr:hypothetical protein [Candidatus Diapherotrites archaeon]MBT7241011.1 hypothetical protein [Candidatus Diapherotrites archaeon]
MKGFFSTIFVIATLLILLTFNGVLLNTTNQLDSLENDLMILENASMKRVVIENNIDRIIQLELEEQMNEENFNLILIQTEINSSLLKYLQNKASATNIFFENKIPLNLEYLMLNSSAYLLEIKGIKYAEYSYTSLPFMDTIVSSKLGKDSIIYFKIPVGYTIQVIR